MSGQSIMDRVTAAKHSIAGQGLAKTVCKSTTEEVMGPKKKHLDYLLQCTNEPNVSIPQLADLLIERTQNTSWVIVFKALISMHNLMNYGNERFTQYLASNNCTVNLASFIDKTGVQGYDMSTFIRRYSKYFNEKAYSYRTMAYDFCKVKRGREDGLLRTMSSEKLLKALPVLQRQIDALLEFDCSANELTNGVINAAFMLLFKDLIRLFACYNDGVINLLEKYFDMNKKHCKEALDIYKKFLVRMDKVSEFLRVAENVGIDKGDIPDLAKGLKGNSESAPASLLDALEQHMLSLEGKKGATSNKPSTTVSKAINSLDSNISIQVTDEEKKKILEEENNRLQQLKGNQGDSRPAVDLFGADVQPVKEGQSEPPAPQVDLLGSDDAPPMQEQKAQEKPMTQPPATNNPFVMSEPVINNTASPMKPSDDLVNLNSNPFIEDVQKVMQMNTAAQSQNTFGAPAWGAPAPAQTGTSMGGFADNNFANFSTSNGTAGGSAPIASLDVSTTLTSAIPLTPSPTNVPTVSAPAPSYDPYEAFSGLGAMGNPPTGGTMEGLAGGLLGQPAGADNTAAGFADVTQQPPSPVPQPRSWTPTIPAEPGFDAFGEVMQPQNLGQPTTSKQPEQKMSGNDLDMMNLAGNLTMNGANQVKKQQHQWQPTGERKKTGGDNWGPTQLSQGMTWSQQPVQPQMGGMMYGPPATAAQPMMNPVGMGAPAGAQMGMPGMAPMGMQPMGAPMPMGQPMYGGVRPVNQPMGVAMGQPRPPASQPNDPFGAL